MEFCMHPDGSLDIVSDGIQILHSYPAVDGIAVRPLRVETEDASARYILNDAELVLKIQTNQHGIIICSRICGLSHVHDISLISAANVQGCAQVFRQGPGIGGPSGFVAFKEDTSVDSDALIAVGATNNCLTLHMRELARYHCHFELKNGLLAATVDVEETLADEMELPPLYLWNGTDCNVALRACAGDIAASMCARKVTAPAFHWCSWYYLYHTLDQQTLQDYLLHFTSIRERAPFRHIQIDAGYFPSCGDWLEAYERFPQGLEGAAKAIIEAGYEPGIWIGPFMVGDESKLYRDHPDWMLRNTNGGYVRPWCQYNEPKTWGYRDSDYFVLDTSHPGAMAYLQNVFRTLRGYGYTLFKTDFLFWGLQDSTKVRRHRPGKTSVEYFRDVMRMIRGEIGENASWLGCISPFIPALGYVDMMRIAGDVGAQWEEEGFGPSNMIREIVSDQYFNNLYWQNDPDAVMLRDFHIHLKPEQIEALALLQAMSGGVITTSEPIHRISEDRMKLLELIRPHGIAEPLYPFWQEMRDDIVIINRLAQGCTVLLFNPTNRTITECYNWDTLLGKGPWHLHRLHGECEPADKLSVVRIAPRSCVLLFASTQLIDNEPKNLWIW